VQHVPPNKQETADLDDIQPNQCLRCGFTGPHEDADECIAVLRDAIADLSLGKKHHQPHPPRVSRDEKVTAAEVAHIEPAAGGRLRLRAHDIPHFVAG
jgi:hypothetical protein